MITPQAHIDIGDTTEYIFFKTYRELKKNIVSMINDYGVSTLFVLRSRRGEWGEWFEYWKLDGNDKPVIFKEGWS